MNDNTQTLAQFIAAHAPGHRFGTKALHDLVDGIRKTGKGGSITFTVKIAPDPKRSNALLVSDAVTSKVPQFDPPQRLTWLLPSGEIVDHDPNQLSLDLEQPRTTSTATSTTETAGGVFDQDAPALDELTADERAKLEEQQRRLADFAAEAFSRDAPDDDAADVPAVRDADPAPFDPTLPTDAKAADFDPTDPDAPPMFLEGGDLTAAVTADDFDTSTAMALADAAEQKAPDNVTAIGSKPTRKRAPSKRKTAAAASAE